MVRALVLCVGQVRTEVGISFGDGGGRRLMYLFFSLATIKSTLCKYTKIVQEATLDASLKRIAMLQSSFATSPDIFGPALKALFMFVIKR